MEIINREILAIENNKIEVPFFREGNFIKFRMPIGTENPQVFVNDIPFKYKTLRGMCYIEVEEGISPQKVEVCENVDVWKIADQLIDEAKIEKQQIENSIPAVEIDDKYQREAVKIAYQNSFSLIFGPPGSGKTTVITSLIKLLKEKEDKIAVLSLSNLAVDNVLDRFDSELAEESIRIGTPFLEGVKEMSASRKIKEERKGLRKKYLQALAYEIASTKLEYFVDAIREKEIEISNIEKELNFMLTTESEKQLLSEQKKLSALETKIQNVKNEIEKLSFLSFRRKKKLQSELANLLSDLDTQKRYILLLSEKVNLEKERFKEVKESQFKILSEQKIKLSNELSKLQAKLEKYRNRAEKYKTDADPEKIKEEMDNLRAIERKLIYKAKVIGTTIHTFLLRFRKMYFDTIIIDEVSQVPYPFIFAIKKFCRRLVLLGDPRQLSPVTKTNIPSIFEIEKPDVILKNVRRYPDKIGKIVNALYDENLTCVRKGGEVEWIDVKGSVSREKGKIKNKANIDKILELTKDLDKDSFAVVTPYRYQAFLLRKKGVEAGTIHSFQGQEREQIIIDLTDPDSKFINKNMMVVALSRAKEKVTIIGDLDKALNSKNKTIREVARIYKENFCPKLKKVVSA